jgi:hypothetical protein
MQPTARRADDRLHRVEPGRVVCRGASACNHLHPIGRAALTMPPAGRTDTTLEYRVTNVRPIPMRMVIAALGETDPAGRSTAVAQGRVLDLADGRLYASGSTTCGIMEARHECDRGQTGMTRAPFLYEPLNTLKAVADGIWIADGPAIRFYGMPFPTRMTVVRLDGGLWVHSPIAPEPGLIAEIDALGPVRHLIAPNNIHYASVATWAKRYPNARVWAAPGVAARARSRRIPFPAAEVLGDAPPDDWAGAIDQVFVAGNRLLKEVAFFHIATKTLILTDLIENFEPERLTWPQRVLARLAGNLAPRGGPTIDMKASFTDRAALRSALARMLAWQPQRIVIAHGAWIRENGTAELRRAFRWALQGS